MHPGVRQLRIRATDTSRPVRVLLRRLTALLTGVLAGVLLIVSMGCRRP
jgi:hypothetical protein